MSGKKTSVDIICDNFCELGLLELKILLKCRVVSREWRGALDHALRLLRRVSFPVSVTGEGAKRTLGLVAGGNLHLVGCVCVYFCSTYYKAVRVGGGG